MLETFKSAWNLPLFSVGENTINVGQLVMVLLVLIVGYLASKLLERIIERRLSKTHVGPDAIHALKRISFYTLLVVVIMTAMSLLHVPLGAFAFVSGAVAIGVGFGAQNVVNNFLSGWILLAERPVRIGDFIEIDEHKGVVEMIGNRSTRIRRTDGVHLLIPNSQMLERVVVNWTLIDDRIRTIVRVGVAYGSPLRKVGELIDEAAASMPELLKDPKPVVTLEDFGDNAIIFDVYFWCEVGGERELRAIRSELRYRMASALNEHNITIAFPQRDVHMDTLSPLQIEVVDKTANTRQSD